jgi:hypothetical protein
VTRSGILSFFFIKKVSGPGVNFLAKIPKTSGTSVTYSLACSKDAK